MDKKFAASQLFTFNGCYILDTYWQNRDSYVWPSICSFQCNVCCVYFAMTQSFLHLKNKNTFFIYWNHCFGISIIHRMQMEIFSFICFTDDAVAAAAAVTGATMSLSKIVCDSRPQVLLFLRLCFLLAYFKFTQSFSYLFNVCTHWILLILLQLVIYRQ